MNILVESVSREGDSLYLTASCESVSAFVSVSADIGVQVVCQNAAHRVWRGAGRHFETVDEAVAAYKSPKMKAIIQHAGTLFADTQPKA